MKFTEIGLIKEMQKAVDKMGFSELTTVQREVIPYMREKRDVLALSPTGSGKTFAFGIPLIESIDKSIPEVQAVVLCPTRELAMQIESELKKLTEYVEGLRFACVYGGQNFQRQLYIMRKKPQIIIGTTGRIMDHLRRRTIDLSTVRTMVLDEADEMLNMGFRDDIDEIFLSTGGGLQVLMFSATMSKEIKEISTKYQYDPVTIKDDNLEDKPDIEQYYVKLREEQKINAIERIIADYRAKFCLVFCNTKKKVDEVEMRLTSKAKSISVGALHGDMFQRHRDAVMRSFRQKQLNVLVATDVAARGIDVSDIELIINYDAPLSDEYYVHRIGRTGRAGKSGVAITFLTRPTAHRIKDLEKAVGSQIKEYIIGGITDDFKVKERINSKTADTERVFVNLGEKDGLDKDSLKALIASYAGIDERNFIESKIADVYGFLEVVKEKVATVLSITGKKYGKRPVVIELAGRAKGAIAKSAKGKPSYSTFDKKQRTGAKKDHTGAKREHTGSKKSPKRESAKEHFSKRNTLKVKSKPTINPNYTKKRNAKSPRGGK